MTCCRRWRRYRPAGRLASAREISISAACTCCRTDRPRLDWVHCSRKALGVGWPAWVGAVGAAAGDSMATGATTAADGPAGKAVDGACAGVVAVWLGSLEVVGEERWLPGAK